MEILKVHSYLTRPAKALTDQPGISGSIVETDTKLHEMLSGIAMKASTECDIEIAFVTEDQSNGVRSLLLSYLRDPKLENGRKIAEILQSNTTRRSGLGLIFIIAAKYQERHMILISRFPADAGILAEEKGETLDVELVEKVFMKNEKTYKSAMYLGENLDDDGQCFWAGRVADRQIDATDTGVSQYWVKGFLQSDFFTTPTSGTIRLANYLKEAVAKAENKELRSELMAASELVGNMKNKTISISSLFEKYDLSEQAQRAISARAKNSEILEEKFRFSSSVFKKHSGIRHVDLDNGARLSAPLERFGRLFSKEPIENEKIRFTIEGKIVGEALRKK